MKIPDYEYAVIRGTQLSYKHNDEVLDSLPGRYDVLKIESEKSFDEFELKLVMKLVDIVMKKQYKQLILDIKSGYIGKISNYKKLFPRCKVNFIVDDNEIL